MWRLEGAMSVKKMYIKVTFAFNPHVTFLRGTKGLIQKHTKTYKNIKLCFNLKGRYTFGYNQKQILTSKLTL